MNIPCSKSCCSNKIQSAGEYKEGHFGSVGATQAAEWEIELMSRLCESYACEKEDEEERETANRDIQHVIH